jgi:hypothetical protein
LKVLRDANAAHDLRPYLQHHRTFTAAYLGWAGLKNGELLDVAVSSGFDVPVKGDRTLHFEQNLSVRKIALVAPSAVSWLVIEPHVAKITTDVDCTTPGSFTRVECGVFWRKGPKPPNPSLG